jgi:type IV pilus assembly protein PilF
MAQLTVIIALLAGLALTGCVTTTTGSQPAPSSPDEAADYNMQLGISYLRQNKPQLARTKLETAVRLNPDLATAHSALGVVFERLEDPAGAERHYRRAVDLEPQNPDNLNALAVFTCSRKRDPQAALQLFDRALAIPLSVSTANRAMLNTNAGTCAKSLDLLRAERYLRAALAENPNYGDALLQLAEITLEGGEALQARAFIERYLAANPPSSGALWLAVRIERALNDNAAAGRYADTLLKEFPASNEARLLSESKS